MLGRGRKLRRTRAAMNNANSYDEWHETALELDRQLGLDQWRAEDDSRWYHTAVLRDQTKLMTQLRQDGQVNELAELINTSLYRLLGDIQAPRLYETAFAGTKQLITAYLDETERALDYVADAEEVPAAVRLQGFETAWKVFGRSALMLSGGATLGFYHLGVVKALMDRDLLPTIITGASTGAMIAAGVCARTDDELQDMYDNPQQIRLDGLLPVGAMKWARSGAMLDPARLYEVLRNNIGEYTFAEAHARSGRILAISVAPTRLRQKPRLLSHLTSPDILAASAAMASSALPGLFPPISLERRDSKGAIVPYIESERWIDGSLASDLPKRRLSRLFNANHFIVSQANPHIIPFVQLKGRRGLLPTVAGIASSTARVQGAYAADMLRRASGQGPLRVISDPMYNFFSQDYRGDIDIHPRLSMGIYTKVVSNPSPKDLDWFILEGQRATWPRVAMIRDHTRVTRAFERCLARLRGQVQHQGGA